MDLLSLPVVMIENILSYLSYDEIAKYRVVSKGFNEICKRMLNRGFIMIERRHALALKSVKAQLPRRESERRYHQLSRHSDILTSIETRISMLNMTYSKFIDIGLCCFIPGKVIDEIKRVLSIVETSKNPPRAHEVLQELRDISSMAIEHFDDKISPAFRKKLQEEVANPPPRPNQVSAAMLAPIAMRHEFCRLRRQSVLNTKLSLYLASQFKRFYKRMTDYRKVACRQSRTIKRLTKKTKEQDSTIADLKKRIDECDIKYTELTHTNQAVGGKVIDATSSDVAAPPAQPLRHFSSQIKLDLSVLPIGTSKRNPNILLPNIKPRKSVIKLPTLRDNDEEPPPKPDVTDENRLKPTPSTSNLSPKSSFMFSIAKIQGLASELRHLNSIANDIGAKSCKRSLNEANAEVTELKKQKLRFDDWLAGSANGKSKK